MRWIAAALAVLAGATFFDIRRQSQVAAQLDGLAAEVRELRQGTFGRAAGLDQRDRELFADIVALRVAQALPTAPNVPSPATPSPAAPMPGAPDPSSRQESPQLAPTQTQQAAIEAASRILDAALSTGTLRPEQIKEMRRLSTEADPAAFGELRRRIAMALNRDELRISDPASGLP